MDEGEKLKDYRITVKVRNNRILKAIEAAGGTPGQKWCNENGLNYAIVNNLINMTESPTLKCGKLSAVAESLCEILGKIPDDLWSNEQLYPLERNFSEMEMDYSQICELLPNSETSYLPDHSEIEAQQTKKFLADALSTLTSREQEIIKLHFEDDLTHVEIGKRFCISAPRVAQIEAKALRKLRHPSRAAMIVDCLDISEAERLECKLAAQKYLDKENEKNPPNRLG